MKVTLSYGLLFLCALASLVSVSCRKAMDVVAYDPAFVLETKAVEAIVPNSTYRVIAYNIPGAANQPYAYVSSGTYRLETGGTLLSSCLLDAEGGFVNESSESALNGMSGSYYLVLASPGRAVDAVGSFAFSPDDAADVLKYNAPMSSTLGNYGSIKFVNPLYDQRSKIRFRIYKNASESVESITVTDASVTSVNAYGETVRVYPSTRQVKVADPAFIRPVALVQGDKKADATGHLLYYESEEVVAASGYYAPKSVVAQILGMSPVAQSYLVESDYIYFACSLKQGDRDAVRIRFPINANAPLLSPQMTYIYRITISSNYISLALDVYNDWQNGGQSEEEVSRPSESFKIGTWLLDDWTIVDDLGQTIG